MHLISVDEVTGPAAEPVSATEAKLFCKVDFADDDTLFTILIKSARQQVEKYLNRALITQTLKAYYVNYSNRVYLPYGPHQSVSSVVRKRRNESETLTVNTDFYTMGVNQLYLDLEPTGSINPPGVSQQEALTNWNLEVEFVAGYGTAGTDVPQPIKEAILKIVETNYDNRSNIGSGMVAMPNEAKLLLAPYRVPEI